MKAIKIISYLILSLIFLYILSGFFLLPYIAKKEIVKNLDEILITKTKIEKIILTLSNSRGHIYLRNTFYGVFITELNYDVNISFSERQVDNCLIHTEVILSFDYFEENFKT